MLRHNDFCSAFEFFNAQFSVFIVIVVNGFLKQNRWVMDTGFFRYFFDGFHIDRLGDFQGWLHGFHGHRYAAVFAPFFELDQRRVGWEKPEGFFSHFVGTLQVSYPFEQNGEVGRGWCVILVQIKAYLERLSSTACILLSFEKHATVEPRHVRRRVESDRFVEGSQGTLHIVFPTSLLTDIEQHINHFLRVFNVFKFGNNVPRCFYRFIFLLNSGFHRLVFNSINGLADRCNVGLTGCVLVHVRDLIDAIVHNH